MKKTFLPYLFLSVLLLAGLSFSCSERWQNSDAAISERADFTLAEAKRAFETTYAAMPSTRAEGEFDEDRILDPYGIDPVWESVSFCYGDSLLLADVPFAACYDYRLLRWDEDGVPVFFGFRCEYRLRFLGNCALYNAFGPACQRRQVCLRNPCCRSVFIRRYSERGGECRIVGRIVAGYLCRPAPEAASYTRNKR